MSENLSSTPEIEKKYYTQEMIRQKLHLYHSLPVEAWTKAQESKALLSERELVDKEIISAEEADDFLGPTSTGGLDREIGNDNFVFLSHVPQSYGDVLLEIDPSILDQHGVIANTAGDFLDFCSDENLRKYYKESQIPASQFIAYLEKYINDLENPEWFFGERDDRLVEAIGQAMVEHFTEHDDTKYRIIKGLSPEIKVPKALPLDYVIKVNLPKND